LKAADPDFYNSANSLQYGQAVAVPAANVDKMVSELEDRRKKREVYWPSP
jgi:hypothetical protein